MEKNKSSCKWPLSDALGERSKALLPKPMNRHPHGGGRKRVPYRSISNGIFFVLRTGGQWNALNATSICSRSTAHKRYQEWVKAGVFLSLGKLGYKPMTNAVGWIGPG